MGATNWNSILDVMRHFQNTDSRKKLLNKSLFQIFLKQDSYLDTDTLINEKKRI